MIGGCLHGKGEGLTEKLLFWRDWKRDLSHRELLPVQYIPRIGKWLDLHFSGDLLGN